MIEISLNASQRHSDVRLDWLMVWKVRPTELDGQAQQLRHCAGKSESVPCSSADLDLPPNLLPPKVLAGDRASHFGGRCRPLHVAVRRQP